MIPSFLALHATEDCTTTFSGQRFYHVAMPSLPVIQDESKWLRLYRRAVSMWCGHVADEKAIGSAAVYASRGLASVAEANCVLGELSQEHQPAVAEYFAEARTSPLAWYLPAGDGKLDGLQEATVGIWHLDRMSHGFPQTHPDLTIIPARASFAHVQEIAPHLRPQCAPAEAGEAAVSHLDDPRVDAQLVLRNRKAIGYTSLLSTGEAGFLMDFYIVPDAREEEYRAALTGRVLDVCARSVFRDVYWPISTSDRARQEYAKTIGFALAGEAPHMTRA